VKLLPMPKGMRIYPAFHISLLEPAPENVRPGPVEIDEETQEPRYEVEPILDCQSINRKSHYLVKWLGYDESENTWEPEENLTHELVAQYHHQNKKNRGPVYRLSCRKACLDELRLGQGDSCSPSIVSSSPNACISRCSMRLDRSSNFAILSSKLASSDSAAAELVSVLSSSACAFINALRASIGVLRRRKASRRFSRALAFSCFFCSPTFRNRPRRI
jgi:hypothetical protein